jgi:hypothetical protein
VRHEQSFYILNNKCKYLDMDKIFAMFPHLWLCKIMLVSWAYDCLSPSIMRYCRCRRLSSASANCSISKSPAVAFLGAILQFQKWQETIKCTTASTLFSPSVLQIFKINSFYETYFCHKMLKTANASHIGH